MSFENNSSSEKVIIFDSSTLINFAVNGLLTEFVELRKKFNGRFLITKEVAKEVIEKPLTIKRFELEALKIKNLVYEKILEFPSVMGIDESKISRRTNEIIARANKIFFGHGNPIQIIHSGESSCLALYELLLEKGVNSIISVDERTTRLIGEKPENLGELLQKKLHTKIEIKKAELEYFKKYKFIRSTELIYVAFKKGIIKLQKDPLILDALLYAMKLNGCSISDEEIAEIKKIG